MVTRYPEDKVRIIRFQLIKWTIQKMKDNITNPSKKLGIPHSKANSIHFMIHLHVNLPVDQ